MNIFKKIIEKAKQAIRGEERLWKVFWLWGVLLYVVSNLIGFFSMLLPSVIGAATVVYLLGLIGLCGLILVFVYPIVWIISMWRCRRNIESTIGLVLTLLSSVLFLYVQALGCFFIIFLSLGYLIEFLI
jgi:hypothetical protein